MKAILRLYLRFLLLDLEYMLEYRKSTFLEFLYYLLEMSVWVIFWRVIFSHVTVLGDWSFEDTLILVGMGTSFMGIWASFFLAPSILEYLILDGNTLEKYLVKPVPTFWALIGERFQLRRTGEQIISGLVIIFVVTLSRGYVPSLLNVLPALFFLVSGSVVLTLMFGCVNSLAFWIPRPGLRSFFDQFFDLLWVPLDKMPTRMRLFLTMGMPIMLLATIPTRAFLGKISASEVMTYGSASLLLLVFWGTCFSIAWRLGLRNFQSWRG